MTEYNSDYGIYVPWDGINKAIVSSKIDLIDLRNIGRYSQNISVAPYPNADNYNAIIVTCSDLPKNKDYIGMIAAVHRGW